MNQTRRQILDMLAEDKITADEAERLIDALERQEPEPTPGRANPRPRYLRVVMEDRTGGGDGGRINIRVPLQLLRAGAQLTSLVPPRALIQANAALTRSGVPIDLTELRPQHIGELIEQLDELSVDIDDSDAKVKVFCE